MNWIKNWNIQSYDLSRQRQITIPLSAGALCFPYIAPDSDMNCHSVAGMEMTRYIRFEAVDDEGNPHTIIEYQHVREILTPYGEIQRVTGLTAFSTPDGSSVDHVEADTYEIMTSGKRVHRKYPDKAPMKSGINRN